MTVLLIAEDDPDVCHALERIFTQAGFEVVTASDGAAALRAIVERRPDVVLTDLDMPRLSGLELCRAIRGHHELRDTPVAILSGSMLPDDRRAVEANVCAVMLKPFANRDLVAAVRRLADAGQHDHTADPSPCPLGAAGR